MDNSILLGEINVGNSSHFSIDAYTNANENLLFRLKRSPDAGTLPQGLSIQSDGTIVGNVIFSNLTVFDNNDTTFFDNNDIVEFDRRFEFEVEAYNKTAFIEDIVVDNEGENYSADAIIKISGGNGSNAHAHLQSFAGGRITESNIKITHRGSGYTESPIVEVIDLDSNGNPVGSDAILRAELSENFIISDTRKYAITVKVPGYIPWQNLYVRALATLNSRTAWERFISDHDIFDVDILYRPFDPNFGIQEDIRLFIKGGLEPRNSLEYYDILQNYNFNKIIKFGKLKNKKISNPITNEIYEIVYYEIEEVRNIINNSEEDSLFKSISDIRQDLINDNHEIIPEVTIIPRWLISSDTLDIIMAVPLAYVKEGRADELIFRIQKAKYNPNNFTFYIDRFENENISNSYDFHSAPHRHILRKPTTFDNNTTIFNNGDSEFYDATQTFSGDGKETTFELDYHVTDSSDLWIHSPPASGDISGITNASPAVVTTPQNHSLLDGTLIQFVNFVAFDTREFDVDTRGFDLPEFGALNLRKYYAKITGYSVTEFGVYLDPELTIPLDTGGYGPYTSGAKFVIEQDNLIPVKDFEVNGNSITFTQAPLENYSVNCVFLARNIQTDSNDNQTKWLAFPLNRINNTT